ncbi:MAG TPA: hypothetical protein VE955_10270 [Candidatus Dormibacteraeota bacterium]|nr:hypothetical protein [Candidatus Dormibacteraeota bacterium]
MQRLFQRSVYGHGLTFYGTGAFLLSFFGSRLLAELNPTVVVQSGTIHFHHFWYGLIMMSAAGWLGIAYNNPRLERIYALVFGLGAGLVADEVGLLLTFGDYHSELTTDFFIGAIGFIIIATEVAGYRKVLEKDLIHVSRNERLVHTAVVLVGLSTLFFATNLLVLGAVAAGLGLIVLLMAFEAAKAGMVAGLAYGAVTALSESLLLFFSNEIGAEIQLGLSEGDTAGLTASQIVTLAILVVVLASIIGGVILGAILGIIFSAVNTRYLKGQSILSKAVLFGLLLWILGASVGLTGFFDYGGLYGLAQLALGLAASLIYGYILGRLYPRFRRKTLGALVSRSPDDTGQKAESTLAHQRTNDSFSATSSARNPESLYSQTQTSPTTENAMLQEQYTTPRS